MRLAQCGLVLLYALLMAWIPTMAQEKADVPQDEKARKTYEKAMQSLKEHKTEWALDDFKKADKQDGGHCVACQQQMLKYGLQFGDWKAAELAGEELLGEAKGKTRSPWRTISWP